MAAKCVFGAAALRQAAIQRQRAQPALTAASQRPSSFPAPPSFWGLQLPCPARMKIPPLFLLRWYLRCYAEERLHTGDLCHSDSNEKLFLAPILPLTGTQRTFFPRATRVSPWQTAWPPRTALFPRRVVMEDGAFTIICEKTGAYNGGERAIPPGTCGWREKAGCNYRMI